MYDYSKLLTWGHPCPSVLSCGPLRQCAHNHQAWCILVLYSVSFIISLKVCFDRVVYHYVLYILSHNIYSCIHEYIHIAPWSWHGTHRTWLYSFFMFLEEYFWFGKMALPVLCAWSFHAGLEDKHDQENYRTLCCSDCLHFAEQVCGENLHQNKKSTPKKKSTPEYLNLFSLKWDLLKLCSFMPNSIWDYMAAINSFPDLFRLLEQFLEI